MAVSTKIKCSRSLKKLFGMVRKRPGAFIYPMTLDSLKNFINGCICYIWVQNSLTVNYFEQETPSFYDWICMKEGKRNSPGLSWSSAIKENVSTEEERIKRFFSHFDSYLERKTHIKILTEFKLTNKGGVEYIKRAAVETEQEIIVAHIVTYDESVCGVFIQFFDESGNQISEERYCVNREVAEKHIHWLELLVDSIRKVQ